MSFYRKYRPQTLTELVGQDHVRQTFTNALKNHALSHAYLFTGPRGTGKTSTARIIARAINCEQPREDGEPCNTCSVCVDALAGRLVDLIEIDAASNRGIDEMRDLKEKIQFMPSRSRAKIYIIDEVHMLTKEAFNALLKTLEEPPAHAYFILATTEAHKVPETIISRCQRFDFHRITVPELVGHLKNIATKENIIAEEKALTLIAKQSAGGLRDALGLLEQIGSNGKITTESVAEILGLTRPQTVEDFVFALLFRKLSDALATIDGLVSDGVNLIQFNKSVILKLRELMLERVAENKLPEAREILELIEVFTRAGEELKNAIIPQLPLEMAVITICGGSQTAPELKIKNEELITSEIPNAERIKDKGLRIKTEEDPNPESEMPNTKYQILNTDEPRTSDSANQSKAPEAQRTKNFFSIDVQKILPQVVGQIQKSAVKLAVKECSVLRVEDGKITLGAPNNFLLEKLNLPAVKNELAELFSRALDANCTISFEIAEIKIASAVPEITFAKVLTPKKVDLATQAEALFGEEN